MVYTDVPTRMTVERRASMNTAPDMKRAAWELPAAVWRQMEPLIPPRQSKEGRPRTVDVKRLTEAIFYVLRPGIQWQAVPREHFGPPSTVYSYFAQWVKAGVFAQLWAVA